jgi:hypothetical protein
MRLSWTSKDRNCDSLDATNDLTPP